MNKKIALFFSLILIVILFSVITLIGVREKIIESKIGADGLLAYEYLGNPKEVNYKLVEYLLEDSEEKRKILLEQDISKFRKIEENRVDFYTQNEKIITPLKKGSIKSLFIFHEPYFAVSDGLKIEVIGENEQIEANMPDEENKTFTIDYLEFSLHKAGYKGTYNRKTNRKEYFYYLSVKVVKDIPKDLSYHYVVKIYDYWSNRELNLYLVLGDV